MMRLSVQILCWGGFCGMRGSRYRDSETLRYALGDMLEHQREAEISPHTHNPNMSNPGTIPKHVAQSVAKGLRIPAQYPKVSPRAERRVSESRHNTQTCRPERSEGSPNPGTIPKHVAQSVAKGLRIPAQYPKVSPRAERRVSESRHHLPKPAS